MEEIETNTITNRVRKRQLLSSIAPHIVKIEVSTRPTLKSHKNVLAWIDYNIKAEDFWENVKLDDGNSLWFRSEVENRVWTWYWSGIETTGGIDFYFSHMEDAALFKMFWGNESINFNW